MRRCSPRAAHEPLRAALAAWTAAAAAAPVLLGALCALGAMTPQLAAAQKLPALAGGEGQRCGPAGQPWVSVAWKGQAWEPAQQRAVLEDLRAGLRQKGIAACPLGSAGSEPPIALLELQASGEARVSVGIEVHDALTEKRVLRDLDLRELSPDARALAIAAAADELLRASWAALALEDAPEPSRPAPPEVRNAVRAALVPARVGARDVALGARGAIEHHGGGTTLLGGDAFVTVWLSQRFGLELSVGLRQGVAQDATHGRIESRALCSALDLALALLPRGETLSLAALVGVAVASLRVRGDAAGSAIDAEGSGLSAQARAGVLLGLALHEQLALRAQVGLGAPLRSVEASDGGRVVSSTAGVELHAGLGAEVRF